MLTQLKKIARKIMGQQSQIMGQSSLKPEGEKGIQELGHRQYVGGMWEEIGKLQFEFLLQQGLKPHHCFLDIACGALRGGVHFIPYLQTGNYLGIEKERRLLELGLEQELDKAIYEEKKPKFVISENFEFDKFSEKPQFSIAQSLFTHLNVNDIRLCLKNLRQLVEQDHLFFATFFEGGSSSNPEASHSHGYFRYSRDEMTKFGKKTGWKAIYIGEWQHPKSRMMKYQAV